ncbi:hypothetical protein SNE40_003402 [Patella caerulea]|uniref:CCHC-type domain-containing protein n=1 Tax=Patella caerulea TaxID=87958 RepID=A0AAN8Q573_PATCE
MAEHIIDVEIEDEDIDHSITRRTVKVTIEKKEYVYRKDILDLFIWMFGDARVVEAIAKRDKSEEWFVTLKSETAYEQCLKSEVRVFKGRRFYFSDPSICVINLRVHWVPRDLNERYFRKVFSRYGEVRSVREEESNVDGVGVLNGLRHISILCKELQSRCIPHMIRAAKGRVRMLVTAPGRLPLCLRCNCIGHVSANCSQGRPDLGSGKPLYTEVVGGKRSTSQSIEEGIVEKRGKDGESEEGSDSSDSECGGLVIDESVGQEKNSDVGEMESIVEGTDSMAGEANSDMEDVSSNVQDASSGVRDISGEVGDSCMRSTESGGLNTPGGVKRGGEFQEVDRNSKAKKGVKGGKGAGKKK